MSAVTIGGVQRRTMDETFSNGKGSAPLAMPMPFALGVKFANTAEGEYDAVATSPADQ
jgi:hypothetical protein